MYRRPDTCWYANVSRLEKSGSNFYMAWKLLPKSQIRHKLYGTIVMLDGEV